VDQQRELAGALRSAGLWSRLSWVRRRRMMRAVAAAGEVTWPAGGAWRADGEDLAEGEVEVWLGGMAIPLRECGVALEVVTVTDPWAQNSTGYAVMINGSTVHLYDFTDADERLPVTEDPWMDCTVLPAAAVNRLLDAAGSSHRIAVFWPGGNDGYAVLGDASALRRAVADAGRAGRREGTIP
jgi:hypothetical protein